MSKDKKILIVDDSVFARMAIKKIISKKFTSISEASSGSEAIELLKNEKFDCLLVDYLMPGINGITTIKIIREMGLTTPIIVISANQQKTILDKFFELGVVAVLKKQVSEDELLNAIDKAIGGGA
jgi:CheY-like chemotaxis protein